MLSGYPINRACSYFVRAAVLLVSCACFLPLSSQAQSLPLQAQSADAWIIQSEGDGYFKQAPQAPWTPADGKLELRAGDSLRTLANASITLLYRDGQRVAIGPSTLYEVRENGLSDAPIWLAESIRWAFSQDPPARPGPNRSTPSEPPVLLYPRTGKVLSTTPPLKWLSAIPDRVQYRVRLVHDTHPAVCLLSGNDMWEATVREDTSLSYPQSDSLRRGERYWIELERSTKRSYEDYGCFKVASEGEYRDLTRKWQVLQKQYPSNHGSDVTAELAYAMQLIQRAYFTDALILLRDLSSRASSHKAVQRLLNSIYQDAGPPALISK